MRRQHSKKPIKNMKINKHKRPKRPHERLFTGIFTGNAKGFGFVTPDEGQLEDITGKDIFIPASAVGDALHKDRVEARLVYSDKFSRIEGAITHVIERGKTEIIGTLVLKKNVGWVFPEDVHYDKIIIVPKQHLNGASDRDKVVVKILKFGSRYENPSGRITEIIGHEGEPGADILTIARSMDIPMEFPEKVISQANRVPDHIIPADIEGREDLRDWKMVTIDGPYAKDLDDAVSLVKTETGYTLGVHIADVSNYVQENSALDREALKRGTSVYLADRVIPMLPERLSNGICSLNAGQDRLCLSVIMDMSPEGAVLTHRIVESVIRVDERMSYPDVQRILELMGKSTEQPSEYMGDSEENAYSGDSAANTGIVNEEIDSVEGVDPGCRKAHFDAENETKSPSLTTMSEQKKGIHVGDSNRDTTMSDEELLTKYKDFIPMFCDMLDLSLKIRARRRMRGAIDFDFPEAKILLDEKGIPTDVLLEKANDATRLIEDFMLAANETVAEEFCKREIPFVYRIHSEPDPEKIESVLKFVRSQGVRIDKKKQNITPKEIQQAVESVQGTPVETMVSYVILRAMQQARYEPTCDGHFGLAAKYYCHFTSPIRRYPDLQIHRIIHDCIRGRMTPERIQHYNDILEEVARQSSVTERRATECERETEKLKKAEYMYERIGQEFEGKISSVTSWGMYVELPNTIEGLVRAADMTDDYYSFDETKQAMVGRLSGKTYRLGDTVTVYVKDADLRMHTVDFTLERWTYGKHQNYKEDYEDFLR